MRRVGYSLDSPTKQADMLASQRQVDELVSRGWFALVAEAPYDLEFHFEDEEEWTDFAERPSAGELVVDAQLVELGLSRPELILLGSEPNVARAYRKLGHS